MHKNLLKSKPRSYFEKDATLHTYCHSKAEKTRYQVIDIDKPLSIASIRMHNSPGVLSDLSRLALVHLLPKYPAISTLCLFIIPESLKDNLPDIFRSNSILDPSSRVRYILNRSVEDGSLRLENGILVSSVKEIRDFLKVLISGKMLSVINTAGEGKIFFVPASEKFGYLSKNFKRTDITFNSHFFLMDLTDLETNFDIMGEPYGLLMIDKKIIMPPLYPRSAFFLDTDGKSKLETVSIRDIGIKIDSNLYFHGRNCYIFLRPENGVSPAQKGLDIAVVGRRIVGILEGGNLEIPEAGYVIHLDGSDFPGSLSVDYLPYDYFFGIQVGPSLIENGKLISDFQEPLFSGTGIKYPPTVYPPGWKEGRAARLGMGTSSDGSLRIIWAEGSKPAMYRPGVDSKGFTLSEFSDICKFSKMKNCINLDGGGSSQVSVGGVRSLSIADKINDKGDEFERPIPIGLKVDI